MNRVPQYEDDSSGEPKIRKITEVARMARMARRIIDLMVFIILFLFCCVFAGRILGVFYINLEVETVTAVESVLCFGAVFASGVHKILLLKGIAGFRLSRELLADVQTECLRGLIGLPECRRWRSGRRCRGSCIVSC